VDEATRLRERQKRLQRRRVMEAERRKAVRAARRRLRDAQRQIYRVRSSTVRILRRFHYYVTRRTAPQFRRHAAGTADSRRMQKNTRLTAHGTPAARRWLPNAGLWLRHSRQMPRAYDVEGAYERWLQNMLNRR